MGGSTVVFSCFFNGDFSFLGVNVHILPVTCDFIVSNTPYQLSLPVD